MIPKRLFEDTKWDGGYSSLRNTSIREHDLTHHSRVAYINVSRIGNIVPGNGLSCVWRYAITWAHFFVNWTLTIKLHLHLHKK